MTATSVIMNTSSQELAKKITERLVLEGLISRGAAKQIQLMLADGTMRMEDWRLPIELVNSSGAKQ